MESLPIKEILKNYKGRWLALEPVKIRANKMEYRPVLNVATHDELLSAWESPEISPALLLTHSSPYNRDDANDLFDYRYCIENHRNKVPPKSKVRWGRFLQRAAYECYAYSDYPFASKLYEEAMHIFESEKEGQRHLPDLLLNYGVVSMTGYRPDVLKAERLLTRGLEIVEKRKSLRAIAVFEYELAYALVFQRKYDQACLHLLSALEMAIFISDFDEIRGNISVLSRIATECVENESQWLKLLNQGLDELEKRGGHREFVEELLKRNGMFSLEGIRQNLNAKRNPKKFDVTPPF